MKLAVDIGNTRSRAAIFQNNEMVWSHQWKGADFPVLAKAIDAHAGLSKAIISSVRSPAEKLIAYLKQKKIRVLILDHHTALPIENKYRSKSTLGYDRIASAVGAWTHFPGRNLLVIDAGTAITIDHLSAEGAFSGGNISPGLRTRFRALHEFTGQLPLVEPAETGTLMGADTVAAIRTGVQEGIIFELSGYIKAFQERYSDLQVIMTGGDARFFADKLKNTIFVDLNLILVGLLRILDHNVED